MKVRNKKKTQNISQSKVLFNRTSKHLYKVKCVLAEEETRESKKNREAGETSHLYSTKHSINIKHLEKLHIWLVLSNAVMELGLQQLLNIK